MKKIRWNNKFIFIIVGIIVLGGVGFYFYKNKSQAETYIPKSLTDQYEETMTEEEIKNLVSTADWDTFTYDDTMFENTDLIAAMSLKDQNGDYIVDYSASKSIASENEKLVVKYIWDNLSSFGLSDELITNAKVAAYIEVETEAQKTVVSIQADFLKDSNDLFEGDPISCSDFILYSIFDDGSKAEIFPESVSPEVLSYGTNVITIKYLNFSTEVNIEVKNKKEVEHPTVVEISAELSDEMSLVIGENFIPADFIVTVKYSDGTIKYVSPSSISASKIAEQNTVIISYGGMTYTVDVVV